MKLTHLFFLITALWVGWSCAASSDASSDRAVGSASDGDADSDGEADGDYSDSDSDGDTDSDSDADGDVFVPETEERFDYRIPVSSGKYVFIADKLNDKVIAVDSVTLEIFTTEVGSTPTHVVPLNDNGHVAVISLNSDEVTIIRMNENGTAQVTEVAVRPDTNALSVSHDGRYVIAFWDDLFADESGVAQTEQDITVIDTTLNQETAFDLVVGSHPLEVLFNAEDTKAFVISEIGIDIVDLPNLTNIEMPDQISLFDFVTVNPDETETLIDPSGTYAIGRREDSAAATVALLANINTPEEAIRNYPLHTIPTDVDIAKDGSFGMFTLRGTHEVAVFQLPLPTDPDVDPFTYIDLGELTCGTATISENGSHTALFTSVADSGSETLTRILTVLTKTGNSFALDTTLLNRPIESVVPAPDSGAFIVNHTPSYSSGQSAYSYSLVKLPTLQSKFMQLPAEPVQMLTTDDGEFAYMLLPTQEIDIIHLDTFIVDILPLGSVPQAAGYASLTDKVFVSQEHPSGRMTFMDVDGENVKTITGYTLNDQSTN
ncbi:MAG: hypothetical protein JXX29_14660 [Deltaproteobacteria bacterium]|nr:hypothetical protein [Deltaproteobacteria bacterium]MBN2672922.1 hypothetical protein [Deltaproteobacteria bacterium]